MLTPSNANELCDAIRAHQRMLPVGARTKLRLSQCDHSVALIATRRLGGIVEYDPGEFAFTALAPRRVNTGGRPGSLGCRQRTKKCGPQSVSAGIFFRPGCGAKDSSVARLRLTVARRQSGGIASDGRDR